MKHSVLAAAALMLTGITLCAPVTAQDILAGPIVSPVNNHTYYLLSAATWTASEAKARMLGGHLATVRNQAENDWIYSQFSSYGGVERGLWIGLNDAASEGAFVWASGEPVTFTTWGAGEPNNWQGNEDYVHLIWPSDPRQSQWNDLSGDADFGGIPLNGVVEVTDVTNGWRLAWQNTQNGDVSFWQMNGTSLASSGYIARSIPLAWKLVGALDVNADGHNDLLWHNTQTGDLAYWRMNGTTRTAVSGNIQRNVPLAWRPVAVADLNQDGKKDLVWQNTQNGDVAYWLLNGTVVSSTGYLARAVPTVWQITAALDLNANNKPDLLWRNTSNGDLTYWLMNGTTQTSYGTLQRGVPLAWRLAATADIDGDGDSELIWQNNSTGDVSYWLLNGTTVSSTGYLARGVPLAWQIRSGF
jgi:hypothetical protein